MINPGNTVGGNQGVDQILASEPKHGTYLLVIDGDEVEISLISRSALRQKDLPRTQAASAR